MQGGLERDDLVATRRAIGERLDEPLEEQLPERQMVAVQLAVGRDHHERRLVIGERPGRQARLEPFPGEAVGIGRGVRLERDGGRQVRVVQRHQDVVAVAELDAVGPARLDVRLADLPGREDRRADAGFGEHPEGRQVDRGLGQPHPRGRPPEAHLEVAHAPADLGPPVGRGGERQDRMMERLGDPVDPPVTGDERPVGERIAVASQSASVGPRSHDMCPRLPSRRSAGSTPRLPARSSRAPARPMDRPGSRR